MNRTELMRRVLDRIGQAEFTRVEHMIGSKTLREALELIVDANEGQAQLFIPHYWAEYYHDGRGPVGPKDAKFVVFYLDPADDPRLIGGYPVRVSDIIKLTWEQFHDGLDENARRRAEGGPPFMIVIPNAKQDKTGPADAHPFFDRLAVGAADRAFEIVQEEMDVFVQDLVDTDRDIRPEKDTATFSL